MDPTDTMKQQPSGGYTRAALALALGLTCGSVAAAPSLPPLVIKSQGYLYVNFDYYTATDGTPFLANQVYAEYQIPLAKRHPYPIVLIPGGGQTGTNFTGTPDGRPGWREYLLSKGYAVYVIDEVGRGKAAWSVDLYGPLPGAGRYTNTENRFTAPEIPALWPQAHLHTQWPGTGLHGDPIFDQFLASQTPSINAVAQEVQQKSAISELLDKIGPAIIVTHSMSGSYGWQIADSRPQLVKAVIALEPSGPPFHDNVEIGPPTWFQDNPALARPWGITRSAITYSPPVTDPSELGAVKEAVAESPDKVRCWMQSEPAHQLPNLKMPIIIVAGEASYHAPYDHCTSRYLTQAGVANTFVPLADVGIHGNGHMMMIEENSLDIVAYIERWIAKNVK